jgi:hypothetical protein
MGFDELRRVLADIPDVETGGDLAVEFIAAAEREVGSIPEDYRSFISEFSWLAADSYEIFGLGASVPSYLDLVRNTRDERQRGGLPDDLIPVMNNGGGDLFCVRVADGPTADGAVVRWSHEDSSSSIEGDGFSVWLVDLLRNT